jgi:hypothetical protein
VCAACVNTHVRVCSKHTYIHVCIRMLGSQTYLDCARVLLLCDVHACVVHVSGNVHIHTAVKRASKVSSYAIFMSAYMLFVCIHSCICGNTCMYTCVYAMYMCVYHACVNVCIHSPVA